MTTTAVAADGTAQVDYVDDLNRTDRRRHTLIWVGGLGALLLVTPPVAASIGPVPISPVTAWRIVGHHVVEGLEMMADELASYR
ncbi:MAG: hypothetical protein ACRDTG_16890 [Pseudonocardiaceae bacterium]